MDRIKGLITLAAATTLAACASQGPAAPTTTSATPASAAPSASAAQQTEAKLDIPYGYKAVVKNGQQVYCRTDFDTGSRVHKETTCLTAAQLEKQQENAQSYVEQVQKNGGTGISFNTPGGPGSAPMGH